LRHPLGGIAIGARDLLLFLVGISLRMLLAFGSIGRTSFSRARLLRPFTLRIALLTARLL
jgi:hypothetical protein